MYFCSLLPGELLEEDSEEEAEEFDELAELAESEQPWARSGAPRSTTASTRRSDDREMPQRCPASIFILSSVTCRFTPSPPTRGGRAGTNIARGLAAGLIPG